jgi:hypothetical protein
MKPLGDCPTVDIVIFGVSNGENITSVLDSLNNSIENVISTTTMETEKLTLQELSLVLKGGVGNLICLFSASMEVLRLDWHSALSHFDDEDCFAVTGACLHHDATLLDYESLEPVKNLRAEQTTAFNFCMDFCLIKRDATIRYKIESNDFNLNKWARSIVQQGLHFVYDPKSVVAKAIQPNPTIHVDDDLGS